MKDNFKLIDEIHTNIHFIYIIKTNEMEYIRYTNNSKDILSFLSLELASHVQFPLSSNPICSKTKADEPKRREVENSNNNNKIFVKLY